MSGDSRRRSAPPPPEPDDNADVDQDIGGDDDDNELDMDYLPDEEEEYQPKKRAAVKRKLQSDSKANIKRMIKPKENGASGGTDKPRGPGRPKGLRSVKPKGAPGRPGRPPGGSQVKVVASASTGGGRRGKNKRKSVVVRRKGDEHDQFEVELDAEDETPVAPPKKLKRVAMRKVKTERVQRSRAASDTDEDYEYEVCEYNGHAMAIKPQVFHDEVKDAVSKWETEWTKKEADDAVTTQCPREGCSVDVAARDLEVHAQSHTGEDAVPLTCPHGDCGYEHDEWQNVRTHISKMHRSLLEVWKCDQQYCDKQFSRWVSLRRHIMYKHIYESTSEILALQHALRDEDKEKKVKTIKRVESELPPSVRKKPRRKAIIAQAKKKALEKRLAPKKEVPKNKVLKCHRCLATYKGEEALKEHMERHSQVIYTKCAECDEYFTEDNDLQRHLKENHGQLLHTHRCPLCSYTSSYISDLKIHGYTHQDTKFDCDCCGLVCANPKTLRSHRMRKHPDQYEDKRLVCSFCGNTCPNEVLLQDHARDKHHLRLNGSKRVNTKEQLRFPCTLCDYVGRKQKSLDYHMRLHQEERPFKCSSCNYASKTQNNLKLHMRTHKDLAPLKCPQCEFRGATNKVINQHVMSKHTNEKPFKCTVCDWSTCYSGNLWTHMQIHKKKDGIEIPERPKSKKRPRVGGNQDDAAENAAAATLETIAAAMTTTAGASVLQQQQQQASDLAMVSAAAAAAGFTQSVFTSAGLGPSAGLASSVTGLTSTTPVPIPIPVAVTSHIQPSTVTVPVSLSVDQLPVIQMSQPLLQQHQQQQHQQQQQHLQEAMQQVNQQIQQQRYTPQFTNQLPPVTTEGFQISMPDGQHSQMVDIQIQDASRRSVVGTIPRQAEDDMETVQQLVNLSNMLPTATSVLHNMQPAYARY